MQKTIVFIHGMFQNNKSWENWINYFTQRGYNCIAPSWPLHEGEPAALRKDIPKGLGDLRLQTLTDKYTELIAGLPSPPVIIGHSVGSLLVQLLLNKGLGKMGIAISSVAPNGMIAFDWSLLKNAASISNPLKGDEPYIMTPEGFHASFCNTMSEKESNAAYDATATHDSRNVFRDCMLDAGQVDLDMPHAPLLFITGEKDQIIPPELNEKNRNQYSDKGSITDLKEFSNRGHFICGQPGWEEVAAYALDWILKNDTDFGTEQTSRLTGLRNKENKKEERLFDNNTPDSENI